MLKHAKTLCLETQLGNNTVVSAFWDNALTDTVSPKIPVHLNLFGNSYSYSLEYVNKGTCSVSLVVEVKERLRWRYLEILVSMYARINLHAYYCLINIATYTFKFVF